MRKTGEIQIMKKAKGTRELLGVTQGEMAHLMGISRSHYSMYESGKRNWPTGTPLFIDDLAVHIISAKVQKEDLLLPRHGEKIIREAESLLRENAHHQRLLVKKVEVAQQSEAALLKRRQVVDFLSAQHAKTGMPDKRYIEYIALKCTAEQEEKTVSELFHARLKLKTSEQCATLIRIELQKLLAMQTSGAAQTR